MPESINSHSVVRQLRFVFTFSTVLLLFSLVASFWSIQRLIANSKMVNHTNEVLLEVESIISAIKDAETGQRGYLLTFSPDFLAPYNGAYGRVTNSHNKLLALTSDNPVQQRNLAEVRRLYEIRFVQMRRVIALFQRNSTASQRTAELKRGLVIMQNLRAQVDRVKAAETGLLAERVQRQQLYITYTPFLLVVAAIISMLITAFAYVRIKTDLDHRIARQREEREKYLQTSRRIAVMEDITHKIAEGDYTVRSEDLEDDDLGRIGKALNTMTGALQQTFTTLQNQNWLQTGNARLSDAMRGERNLRKLAGNMIETLAGYLKAPLGTVYLLESEGTYQLAGSYAAAGAPALIRSGEGLVGQAVKSRHPVVVDEVPENYARVRSSLGEARPTSLMVVPLWYADLCVGAVELGLLRKPDPLEITLLDQNRDAMAISVNAALDYRRLQDLLEETQAQSEELQSQQDELQNLNVELEMQAQKLQASEEELRVQQEELQQTNQELEERGKLLEERNDEIQTKVRELELTTRYKSEFLANMSHELRTPLNSILLLSRLLAENAEQNLNAEQIEYARVIQSSGNGLLGLIDEILDLSKIEAGQMKLDVHQVAVAEITDELRSLFAVMAREKGLEFSITVAADVPATVETDKQRLGQVLKNLISNALKFTAKGSVTLTIERQDGQLSFRVADTGIGIPPEKQPIIFEAFQQADGSTKRKYGGTGLGLSISRELTKLLGGDIQLKSEVNRGSEFTVRIPFQPEQPSAPAPVAVQAPVALTPRPTGHARFISPHIPEPIPDDRQLIREQDKVILIVEDDPNFAKALLDFARKKGYRGLVAVRGDEGLELATQYRPQGILLDIELPVMSGWEIMDALKANPQTRPIPVHIMSSHRMKNESLLKGAIDFVDKPVAYDQLQDIFKKLEYVLNRNPKKVLIVEDNPKHARALAYFLETFNINSELKSDIREGVGALKQNEVDCVILDMGIPDSKAYETLDEARKTPGLENLPIIIFTGKSLSMSEELKIKKYADSIIVKTAHSYQRMLDEVSLFLHLVEESQPGGPQGPVKRQTGLKQVLANKTVLVADDDVRNIFSLSKALEQYNMTIIPALDGKEALEKLEENPSVDVVLLDMMMPQMDGYEAARKIRENPRWKSLPVIAVTAKAMTGDREKCIDAGASDYITKPVDVDQLLSLLRVWLYDK